VDYYAKERGSTQWKRIAAILLQWKKQL
jgi:DNA replication protein DnaD